MSKKSPELNKKFLQDTLQQKEEHKKEENKKDSKKKEENKKDQSKKDKSKKDQSKKENIKKEQKKNGDKREGKKDVLSKEEAEEHNPNSRQNHNNDHNINNQDDSDDSELYSSIENSESDNGLPQNSELDQDYKTLDDLIFKLNDQDHSEDEGIEDYKIGGYNPCHVGEVLGNRYVLIQKLGWGHFSTVWLAKDFKHDNYAAVKIMKSSPHYLQASYDEVEILQKVAKNAFHPEWIKSLQVYEPKKNGKFDRDDTHVLNLLNSFLYKGPYGNHFCMVFEILGVNLLQVLKSYDYKGLPLHLVKEIARQVLMGLDFLNRICRVIHTDLKPENVLLCLTDQEIKKIVEGGQLASKELYKDRLQLYRSKYDMGPMSSESEEEDIAAPLPLILKDESGIFNDSEENEGQNTTLLGRIAELQAKLKNPTSTKTQKKNARNKLNKCKDKLAESENKSKIKRVESVLEEIPKSQQKVQKKKKTAKTLKELFSAFDTKLILCKGPKIEQGFKVKIADLGNACWQHHHFATEIQTRQYRGPQVIIGSKYSLSADMWSFACMVFEMLTAELLFNPRKDGGEAFGKNDDHLAQMMELLGRFPKKFSHRGSKSRKYFTANGSLCRIPKLQNYSVKDVMIAKYKFCEAQAELFENFMTPMLNCFPQKRISAAQMLKHPWLYSENDENYFMDSETHEKIKAERYDLDEVKQEYHQYESENEDGEVEDNNAVETGSDLDQYFGYEKIGDIRYIDRSFMDLGYIGFGDGIYLQKLDFGANWQFA